MSAGRKKSKRIKINERERWEQIVKGINKKEIPVTLLDHVVVNLLDGTQVAVNIRELLDEGNDPDELEQMLNSRLDALNSIIKDVDFHINLDSVAKTVQPVTNDLLKNL
jgi:hypothetical protein